MGVQIHMGRSTAEQPVQLPQLFGTPFWTRSVHLIHSVAPENSGVLGGIRGYTTYTNIRVFLTAYTHLSDHK